MTSTTRSRSLIVLVPVLACLLSGCDFDKRQFVDTAKMTFDSFFSNNGTADTTIDWTSLRINDDEIGSVYMTMATDYERSAYRKSQIARLRTICNVKGWSPQNMRDWRIKERGVESATVVADGPGGSISISMRKVGAQKRIGLIRIL